MVDLRVFSELHKVKPRVNTQQQFKPLLDTIHGRTRREEILDSNSTTALHSLLMQTQNITPILKSKAIARAFETLMGKYITTSQNPIIRSCQSALPRIKEELRKIVIRRDRTKRKKDKKDVFVLIAFDYCELGKKNELYGYSFGDLYLEVADLIANMFLREVKVIHSTEKKAKKGAGDERALFFTIKKENLMQTILNLCVRLQTINYTISACMAGMHFSILRQFPPKERKMVFKAIKNCASDETTVGAKYTMLLLPIKEGGEIPEKSGQLHKILRVSRDMLTFSKQNGGLEIIVANGIEEKIKEIGIELKTVRENLRQAHERYVGMMDLLFPPAHLVPTLWRVEDKKESDVESTYFSKIYGYVCDKNMVYRVVNEVDKIIHKK